jgi:hypothetical protein
VLRTKLDHRAKTLVPQAFKRRIACGAEDVSQAVAQAPTDKSFLLLFFKKEALPSDF